MKYTDYPRRGDLLIIVNQECINISILIHATGLSNSRFFAIGQPLFSNIKYKI